jgi:hypothetical protein
MVLFNKTVVSYHLLMWQMWSRTPHGSQTKSSLEVLAVYDAMCLKRKGPFMRDLQNPGEVPLSSP